MPVMQQHAAVADHAVLPAGHLAAGVLRRLQALEGLRAEHAVGDVLFPRPQQLDRAAHLLGDACAFGGVVAERAAAEASAHVALVHGDGRGLEAQRLRHLGAGGVRRLAPFPHFGGGAGIVDAHHRVERLHLRVVAVIAAELRLVDFRGGREGGLDVALRFQVRDLRLRIVVQLGVGLQRAAGIEPCRSAFLPGRLERVARGHRLLEVLGDDGDAVGQAHRADDARHLPDVGVVPALRLAGVNRGVQARGVDHAG